MSWHLLDKVVTEVSKQSTIAGKWMSLLIILRIVALTRIAETLYSDEQAAFKCNTKQPGCENVCFNQFSPISHVRFWSFQLIIITNPAMIFLAFATHAVSKLVDVKRKGKSKSKNNAKKKAKSKSRDDVQTELKISNEYNGNYNNFSNKKKQRLKNGSVLSMKSLKKEGVLDLQKNNFESSSSSESTENSETSVKSKNSMTSEILKDLKQQKKITAVEQHIKIAYVVQSIARTIFELSFIIVHLTTFGFRINELFKCSIWPCPNVVDCFVSRPGEKTTVLISMFGISMLSFALGLYEVVILAKDSMGCGPRVKEEGNISHARGSVGSYYNQRGKVDMLFIKKFISQNSEKSDSSSTSESEKSLTSINTEDLEEMYEDMDMDVGDFDNQQDQEQEFV